MDDDDGAAAMEQEPFEDVEPEAATEILHWLKNPAGFCGEYLDLSTLASFVFARICILCYLLV